MSDRFYSTQEAVSDGTLTQLMVTIDFKSRDNVYVFFDGVEYPERWEWASPSTDTILFHDPVPEGQTVLVRRLTDMDEVPFIFGEGSGATGNSQFSHVTVDENFDFFKRATQDSMDSFRLTGASAEQAEFWARRAEDAEGQALGHRNSAAASASSASTSASNAASSAVAAGIAEQGALAAQSGAQSSASAAASSASTASGHEDAAAVSASAALDSQNAAATSASSAASSASSASSSATTATNRATSAANSATAAATSATQSSGFRDQSQGYANDSQIASTASQTARTGAEAARDRAQEWASNPEDVPVVPGEYSALHWAEKAREFAGGGDYLEKSQNLEDLPSPAVARTNLGLGTASLADDNLLVPVGLIAMWSGSAANIPSGWALCNGQNGTPNLTNRFIVAAGGDYAVGDTGDGSIPSHSHGAGTLAAASGGAHTHTASSGSAGAHTHSGSTNSTGAHTHPIQSRGTSAGSNTNNFPTTSSAPQNTFYDRADVRAASAGAHSHTVTINSNGAHTHTVSVASGGAHTHSITGSTAASGSGSEVIAKYFALAYIMKL